MLLIQIIIPATFIIITVLSEQSRARFDDLPRFPIVYDVYHRTETVLQIPSTAAATGNTTELADAYRRLFGADAKHTLRVTDTDMERFALSAYAVNTPQTNREMVCGASVLNATHAIAWFNNQPYHGAPLAVHTLHAAAVRAQLGDEYSIELANWPIPYTADTRAEMVQMGGSMGFQLAVNVSFAMAFVAAFYVLAYIRVSCVHSCLLDSEYVQYNLFIVSNNQERTSGSKHLQLVSGSRVISYWLTALAWDYLTYMATVLVLLVIFAAFQQTGWASPAELARITFVLALFGWAVLPVTYLASRLFRVPASGYTRMAMCYVFTGMACFFIVFVMSLPAYDLKDVADALTWVFLVFPHFALSHSLNSINLVVQGVELCRLRCDAMPGCTQQVNAIYSFCHIRAS